MWLLCVNVTQINAKHAFLFHFVAFCILFSKFFIARLAHAASCRDIINVINSQNEYTLRFVAT